MDVAPYWGFRSLEFKSGDKCPKCGDLFIGLNENEKNNFGSCCGDTDK